jgi:hypothetical protein
MGFPYPHPKDRKEGRTLVNLTSFAHLRFSSGTYEWEVPYHEVEINEKLGQGIHNLFVTQQEIGSYGEVFRGRWRGSRVVNI